MRTHKRCDARVASKGEAEGGERGRREEDEDVTEERGRGGGRG